MSIDNSKSKPLSKAAFSRLAGCSRQNVSVLVKKEILVENENGKLDPTHPANEFYLLNRKENPRKVTNPGKGKTAEDYLPPENEPEPDPPEQPEEESPSPEPKKKTNRKKSGAAGGKTDTPKTPPKRKTNAEKKIELEIEKLQEQRDKLKLENLKARAELVEREGLADTIFGYLSALNQNLLSMPDGFIDQFRETMKADGSRQELMEILTIPISQAIKDTKKAIQKEIEKAKKEAGH